MQKLFPLVYVFVGVFVTYARLVPMGHQCKTKSQTKILKISVFKRDIPGFAFQKRYN